MYKQYQLPYAYEALEPHIDALTMETHYSKHHAAYTKNLNDTAEKAGVAGRDITELLANLDSIADSGLRKAIRNNGGGYYNHNLYFSTISPDGGGEPEGALAQALTREFGGFAAFKEQLSALALGQFGSGWAWLSVDKNGKLHITKEGNGSNPVRAGLKPLLGFDVWEHSYYLDYQNRRADHVNALWSIIDWDVVENRM